MEADTDTSIIKKIILCVDGETWTEKAVIYAIDITMACKGTLTALHVINPYLKKFADEIYAVGRNEYRDHIDNELRKEADTLISEFKKKADQAGLSHDVIVRYGSPDEEIIKEISDNQYDLLIMGGHQGETFNARIRSFNLSAKIFRKIKIPALFVK